MDAEAANNAAAEAKVRVDKAEEAKAQALNAAQQAQQDKDKGIQDAQAKADKAISAANEKVRLTEQFYEEYSEMDQNLAKQICDALKIEIPKDTIVRNGKSTKSTVDAKTVLKRAFSNFDNKGKQKIINEIHQAKKK